MPPTYLLPLRYSTRQQNYLREENRRLNLKHPKMLLRNRSLLLKPAIRQRHLSPASLRITQTPTERLRLVIPKQTRILFCLPAPSSAVSLLLRHLRYGTLITALASATLADLTIRFPMQGIGEDANISPMRRQEFFTSIEQHTM
ncbi:hypothetical protein LY78DRAFT_262056 [Colletotrichum sublineola]|nr:hypothetical protein LY78DRAFT_262056 [Colletotrichum sublineola]